MKVDNLLSWESTDGSERCFLIVTDKSKHHREVGYRKIILCKKNGDDEWETIETIDSIDNIDSFGIPPGFTD